MTKSDLSSFNNDWYNPGAGALKRLIWHYWSLLFFESGLLLPYNLKVWMLKIYGAKVGRGVVIKPHVQIKYPWKLAIGNHVWIGERVWIDNLDTVTIEDHVCVSQDALILTGNHNFKKSSFDLIVKPIKLCQGSWVGAKSTVSQGVVVGDHAVLSLGSVASSDLDAYGIYRGNPASKVSQRAIEE